MTVETWKNDIVDALRKNLTARAGRAGSTPLSVMANQLKALPANSEDSANARDALISLINNPAVGFDGEAGKRYWRGLSLLSDYLRSSRLSDVAAAFHLRLKGPAKLPDDLLVFALNGLATVTDQIDPKLLRELNSVLEHYPLAWINAAVRGGNYDLAEEQAIECLKGNKLDIDPLILGLKGWRRLWEKRVNFANIIDQFINATNDVEAKQRLQKWLDRRGMRPSVPALVEMIDAAAPFDQGRDPRVFACLKAGTVEHLCKAQKPYISVPEPAPQVGRIAVPAE